MRDALHNRVDLPRAIAERWLRRRFAFPALVLAAAALLIVSELTYERATATMRGAMDWTEARAASDRLLQRMSEAEAAQRTWLLTGDPADRATSDAARAAIPAARDAMVAQFGRLGEDGRTTADDLVSATDAALSEGDALLTLARDGRRDEAIARLRNPASREPMTALRLALHDQLRHTSRLQGASRRSLDQALLVNRVGVGALAVASVFGLFVFMRQIRLQDAERTQQQALLASERTRLAHEVQRRTAELRELARHLQTAREDERAHLARELHDELGGLLTALKLDVARLRMKIGEQPDLRERLDHMGKSLNDGIAFKRRVVEDLRPSALANLGLKVSLEGLCTDMSARLDVPIDTALDEVRLAPGAEIAVYRFVQEALTNIGKHAAASHVEVTLRHDSEQVVVAVQDDGQGFDSLRPRPGHHGLTGMRFRVESLGGAMTVQTSPGQGTTLRAEFPFERVGPAAAPESPLTEPAPPETA
ncbi:ATP-binding protein [Rhizobacter sp. LjRoot28]|jgi:signal transduction histidine kinase|uniref:sensor histidine kinase n=1 Tax=Rhizobacter sp. LjRoot28 TaxID=3342309 RepID=UPI003ECC831D